MKRDRTFVDLVREPSDEDLGSLAGLSFGVSSRPGWLGEYSPVLTFLATWTYAELEDDEAISRRTDSPAQRPRLTKAIEDNARALDEELASGRCDD